MPSSNKTVYVAIGTNLVVAAAKFVAATFTGSASMLAEGVHTLIDAGNNGLLLIGERAARREPDEAHPFGYGKEPYFWSLIVAMFLFALGGGVSTFEGVSRLLEPNEIEQPTWNYIVLAVAFLSNGYSWMVATRQLRAKRQGSGLIDAVRSSKDPSNFTVWFEDTADLLGVGLAFLGVLASQLAGSGYPDAIASLLIGLMMAGTAVLLAYESKKLLIGEGADPELVAGIREIVEADEDVSLIGPPLTMQLGPEDVLLNLDVQFRTDLPAEAIFEAVDRLERRIRDRFGTVRRIFIEAKRLRRDDGPPIRSPRAEAGHAGDGEPAAPYLADRTPADD